MILVVDQLGETIRVPIMFCSTWKVGYCQLHIRLAKRHCHLLNVEQEFDFMIKGCCRKNRFGDQAIMRDDYEVIRAQDSQIINPPDLGRMVEAGMVLEISIFLRQSAASLSDRKKCLRCGHINLDGHGWIHWKVPLDILFINN